MVARPSVLVAGVVLSIVIGLSGVGVGLTFLGAALSGLGGGFAPELAEAGLRLGIGFGAYGFLVTAGAVGVWRRSWPGWWLAVAALGLGFVTLVVLAVIASLDGVLLGGVAIWGLTIALVGAPSTRAALR
jgi:hypothetical protein